MNNSTFNTFDFTEYTEDDISPYLTDYSSYHDINTANQQFFNDDFDPKFRSIQVLSSTSEAHFIQQTQPFQPYQHHSSSKHELQQTQQQQYQYLQGIPPLSKDSFIEIPKLDSKYDIIIDSSTSIPPTTTIPSIDNIVVPEKPFFLGPAQFITTLCLAQLISNINQQLEQFFELSYNFFPDHCRWEIVFLRGSSRSKFEIHVFREDSQSFVIEGNRLSGDSYSFHNVFEQIESSLTESKRKQRSNRTVSMDCIPLPAAEQLPMDDVISALKPILTMATSPQLDTRAEASKMLCDLSLQLDLQSSLCAAGGIEILMELITIDFGSCNQHAMCALANLSSSRSCQEILIKGGNQFLNILLGLISDGPYQTAEMRRECARTLANLCCNHSKKIINAVGVDSASLWIASVDSIKDERLKLHASRAKMNMEACM